MLEQHQRFFRYEIDAECGEASLKCLVETYAEQELNDKSYIKASDDMGGCMQGFR